MKKVNFIPSVVITLFTAIILISCEGNYPPEQKEFINKIKSFQKEYNDSKGNDIAQDNACANLDKYVKGKSADNWEASVIQVNSFLGSRWIVAEGGGISFKIWPENDEKWSQLGEHILSDLKKGDIILFSGTVIREMSITCGGKMREPEIKIDPSSISIK
jgi:hypothetical protein